MTAPRSLRSSSLDSPVGPLLLVVDDADRLAGLVFADGHTPPPRTEALGVPAPEGDPVLVRAAAAVLAYLEGRARAVDVPLAPREGTGLQRAVWDEVASIPRGQTRTYGEVAAAVGRPTAVRAVGRAVSLNPVCLAVPCHRVVGSGGRLTGYAGGVDRKRWLLALEGSGLP